MWEESTYNIYKNERNRGVDMDKLYIVIPAYNEEVMIETVIGQWHQVVADIGPDSRLVVIDDGSKDHTYEIMQKCQEKYPQLIPLTKPNGGHGPTVRYGYQYAIDQEADYIFQTDSDGQTLPEEFPKFWQRRTKGAMIIGKRTNRQDGFSRVIVTNVLKLVVLAIFHVYVPDANTPFRLIKADVLKQYMHLIPVDYNLSNVLVSVIFMKKKLGVEYYPITFRPRQGGVNSINIPKITKLGIKALKDFRELAKTIK